MKVLVTGADGFVGRWLTDHLTAAGDEVWTASGLATSISGSRNAVLDLRDADAVTRTVQDIKPQAIYHLAAIAFGPDAQRDAVAALQVNAGGTLHVLAAAAVADDPPIVFIPSSAEVYGRHSTGAPLSETQPLAPVNAYGCTKAAQEMIAMAHHLAQSLPVVIARAFNHVGPGQRDVFVVASLARQLATIATEQGEPVIRVGNLSAERDFTDVRDVVAAYRLLVDQRLVGTPYNIASGRAVSVRDVLDRLIGLSGVDVEVVVEPDRLRSNDAARIVGDAAKLRAATGWRPRIGLDQTLRDVWNDAYERARGAQR